MGAVCQSQLPLLDPLSQWEGRAHCCSGGRAVQWCLANPLYCQRSINPRSMIKNIINQRIKINVKCLVLHSSSGEKRANYFAQIMFKHSLDIEAAFSAESVILYHLSMAVFCPSKNSNYYTQHCGLSKTKCYPRRQQQFPALWSECWGATATRQSSHVQKNKPINPWATSKNKNCK